MSNQLVGELVSHLGSTIENLSELHKEYLCKLILLLILFFF